MNVETFWITRYSDESAPPELLVAWDEHSVEAAPEGFAEACRDARLAVGSDLKDSRHVLLSVGGVDSLFESPTLRAVVAKEGQREQVAR